MPATMMQQYFEPQPEQHAPAQPAGAPAPQEIILQAGLGYVVSSCLQVAAKLKIADLIGNGSKTVEYLAFKTGMNEEYLYRLLRVLEVSQIVSQASPKRFALTSAGQLLRQDTPGTLLPLIDWITDPLHLSLYSKLEGSIRTGETTFNANYGMPFFNWLSKEENAEEATVFNNAMTCVSEFCIPAFLEAFSFEGFAKIIDVGGGHGALLRSILKKNPGQKGVVAEMAAVLPETRKAIVHDGLSGRCEAVECNFFEQVPAGGDCYLMKNIVHDWAEESALRLLRNIRAVIPQTGKLILAEGVLDETPAPHPGKMLDIEMMVFVGGKERTEEEYRSLLSKAGFVLERVVPTKSPLSLIEASPF